MATANAAQARVKTVADPCAAYESMTDIWKRCRVICNGERAAKDFDAIVDVHAFSNLLIPFSPSMEQKQYNFFKAEAELPGICAQYSKMLVGALLRKKPSLTLPKDVPEGAQEWILNQFAQDESPLVSFLDSALWEEIQTSRAWVYVDHPRVEGAENMDKEERDKLKPYPVLWDADFVINWRVSKGKDGRDKLSMIITAGLVEEIKEENEFHPEIIPTVWVHDLDPVNGYYRVREYRRSAPTNSVTVTAGRTDKQSGHDSTKFELHETYEDLMVNNERLDFIPAWPLNGSIDPVTPIIAPIVDKEVSLYNKISRRNHLLYGAATYTPVISTNMSDSEFQSIVNAGLGSWIRLQQEDKADILKTPTEALADMDRCIAASIEEMARLGIRMLSPESEQSGVALQLRNASQTAQLGTLNSKVSATMASVITFMLNSRYDLDLTVNDVSFSLSADFNPTPLGADWLRLATEWYQAGLIPRTVWLEILKHNDMLDPEYDDEKGQKEINQGMDLIMSAAPANTNYAANVAGDMKDEEDEGKGT